MIKGCHVINKNIKIWLIMASKRIIFQSIVLCSKFRSISKQLYGSDSLRPNLLLKGRNSFFQFFRPVSSNTKICKQKENNKYSAELPTNNIGQLGLVSRFKRMYKDYWYVLVPAHLVTSAVWFSGFYYLSKSGFDIAGMLQSWNFGETLIKPFRDSSVGHVAVAYLLYKIATPARYAVTVGSTTFAIKYLVAWGVIKPVPSRERLLQLYQDKKLSLQDKVADKRAEFDEHKQSIIDDIQQFKDEFRDGFKTKVKREPPRSSTELHSDSKVQERNKNDQQIKH